MAKKVQKKRALTLGMATGSAEGVVNRTPKTAGRLEDVNCSLNEFKAWCESTFPGCEIDRGDNTVHMSHGEASALMDKYDWSIEADGFSHEQEESLKAMAKGTRTASAPSIPEPGAIDPHANEAGFSADGDLAVVEPGGEMEPGAPVSDASNLPAPDMGEGGNSQSIPVKTAQSDPVVAQFEKAKQTESTTGDPDGVEQSKAFDMAMQAGWDWEGDQEFLTYALKATPAEVIEKGLECYLKSPKQARTASSLDFGALHKGVNWHITLDGEKTSVQNGDTEQWYILSTDQLGFNPWNASAEEIIDVVVAKGRKAKQASQPASNLPAPNMGEGSQSDHFSTPPVDPGAAVTEGTSSDKSLTAPDSASIPQAAVAPSSSIGSGGDPDLDHGNQADFPGVTSPVTYDTLSPTVLNAHLDDPHAFQVSPRLAAMHQRMQGKKKADADWQSKRDHSERQAYAWDAGYTAAKEGKALPIAKLAYQKTDIGMMKEFEQGFSDRIAEQKTALDWHNAQDEIQEPGLIAMATHAGKAVVVRVYPITLDNWAYSITDDDGGEIKYDDGFEYDGKAKLAVESFLEGNQLEAKLAQSTQSSDYKGKPLEIKYVGFQMEVTWGGQPIGRFDALKNDSDVERAQGFVDMLVEAGKVQASVGASRPPSGESIDGTGGPEAKMADVDEVKMGEMADEKKEGEGKLFTKADLQAKQASGGDILNMGKGHKVKLAPEDYGKYLTAAGHSKEAVDEATKDYYENYYGNYGKELVKDIALKPMSKSSKTAAKIDKIWVVTKPTEHSELVDIFFDTDFEGFIRQARGGLREEDLYGVYDDEAEAEGIAKGLLAGPRQAKKAQAAPEFENLLQQLDQLVKDGKLDEADKMLEDLKALLKSRTGKVAVNEGTIPPTGAEMFGDTHAVKPTQPAARQLARAFSITGTAQAGDRNEVEVQYDTALHDSCSELQMKHHIKSFIQRVGEEMSKHWGVIADIQIHALDSKKGSAVATFRTVKGNSPFVPKVQGV